MSDLKSAIRQLLKAPGFTLLALVMLALGIGATTVTFSLVHGVLLRPLPVAEPGRLVALNEVNAATGFSRGMSLSYTNFLDWRRDNQTLSGAAIFEDASYTLSSENTAAGTVDGTAVTAGFFETLGVAPILGRTFQADEESPTGRRVVVLSHDFWTRHFGAKPDALGRTLRLDGELHTIIGVMPAGFRVPDNDDLWTPVRQEATALDRGSHGFDGIGRLKPGVTIEQARLDLNAIAARLATAFPNTNSNVGALVTPLAEVLIGDYGRLALTLFGAVGCLLLITCVNIASLLLARGAAREREMAVRAALGAGRGRILRQLFAENLLLGLAGGLLGLVVATWGLDLLANLAADQLPFWIKLTLDWPVLLFASGVSVLASVVFGLAPAWQLARISVNESLKEGGRSGSAARSGVMRWLVGAELALALVLLVGAGLMMKSFLALRAVNPGFEPRQVLTFHLSLPGITYPAADDEMRVHTRIVEGLSALPGVEAAALISNLPLGNSNWGRSFTVAGRTPPPLGQAPVALNRVVSPEYFRAMRTPILRGRGFTAADSATSPKVAIIDETFAREIFPNEDPLGQRIRYGRTDTYPWMEIVGVAGDVRHYDLQNSRPRPGLYVPLAQNTSGSNAFFVLRTSADPSTYATAVTKVVAEVDQGLAVAELQPMTQWVSNAIWRDRLAGGFFTGFAALALTLAALGVYGVTAFATTQRTREIGVRMALGAQPRDVLRLVLGGGARLAGLALVVGLILAFGLTRFLGAQLYHVSPLDPAVFGIVTVVLGVVTVLACWLPARRATKVNPVVALRAE